jgi:hypothetical protein
MLTNRADPDAPAGQLPPFEPGPDAITMLSEYRDNVVEAFAVDGDLLTTAVFDRVDESPTPITPRLWYRVDDDIFGTVVILEPVLSPIEPR